MEDVVLHLDEDGHMGEMLVTSGTVILAMDVQEKTTFVLGKATKSKVLVQIPGTTDFITDEQNGFIIQVGERKIRRVKINGNQRVWIDNQTLEMVGLKIAGTEDVVAWVGNRLSIGEQKIHKPKMVSEWVEIDIETLEQISSLHFRN